MDYLRSAYSTNMQFDDAGELIAKVRWYRAPTGAQDFPGTHLFCSTNWSEGGQPILGPGERWDSPKVYSKGQTPAGPKGIAGFQCGPSDYFRNGCPSDTPPLDVYPDGVGKCCYTPPGGLLIAGGMPLFRCAPYDYDYKTWVLVPGQTWKPMFRTGFLPYFFIYFANPPTTLQVNLYPLSGECYDSEYFQQVALTDSTIPHTVNLQFVYWSPVTYQSIWQVPLSSLWYPGQQIVIQHGPFSWFGTGGLEIGGRATSDDLPWSSTGGLKAGGLLAAAVDWSSSGGSGIGGGIAAGVPMAPAGGLQAGGSSAVNLVRLGSGGLKIGGGNTSSISRTGSGGVKPGGEYSSYVGVVTACCGSTPVNENLSVTNVTTGNSGTASYSSGVGGWVVPLTVVSPQCMLKCQNIGSGNKWYVIEDGNACFTPSVMSATCGPPFSASGTVAYSGKPGCPSGSFSIHFSG